MKKVDIRVVMKRAWEIAREGQKKFGGKVKEYFAMALKLAWKEVKKVAVKLVGSEKQIKWAEDIRKNVIEKMERIVPELEVKIADILAKKPRKAEAFRQYKEAVEQLKAEQKAAFWIDSFGYGYKLHTDVIFNFKRYLERNGKQIVNDKIREDISVAEKLDLEN